MSGWIKIEKDLITEPRFRRMVKALAERGNADVTHMRVSSSHAVTQVLGGLAMLWIYADTHIREDDTLDVGADEIDELVGITGFAQVMPEDWLQVLDANRVKLPGFQEHNGTEAKKKALTQKRVARHRIRTVTQERFTNDGKSNAVALPDQTKTRLRPDHIAEGAKAALEPGETQTPPAVPTPVADETEIRRYVDAIKAAYPKAGRADWITAEKCARTLVLDGAATWATLLAGVKRYAAHCAATGRIVSNPARFFSDVDQPWSQEWAIPALRLRPGEKPPRDDAAAWAEARSAAKDVGFRDPYRQESVGAYMTQVKLAADRAPPPAIRELAAKARSAI